MCSIYYRKYYVITFFLTITFTVDAFSLGGEQCQSPWFRLFPRDRFYYLITQMEATFEEIEDFCHSIGGSVAEITSESDYLALIMKLELGKKLTSYKLLNRACSNYQEVGLFRPLLP